jgi:hypothetical protein
MPMPTREQMNEMLHKYGLDTCLSSFYRELSRPYIINKHRLSLNHQFELAQYGIYFKNGV